MPTILRHDADSRLGLVRRALIMCPANLATKWVDDFARLLGGGLRQITAAAIREDALWRRAPCVPVPV